MRTFDEEIARSIQAAAKSGELGRARGYGKPIEQDPGWDSTPPALRMPMKILKDAGAAPAEIAWFHERARLRECVKAAPDEPARVGFRRQLVELEQKIALRLETLRVSGAL